MMKRLLVLGLSILLVLSLAACGATTEQLPTLALPESSASSGEESSAAQEEPAAVSDADYEDNLDGLCQYMETCYAVTGEPVEMAYDIIGAVAGVRYRFQYNGVTLQVEFYEFDLDNFGERGQECLDSVRETGEFTMLDDQVPALLSDNGKYMMIYTDADDSEENTAQRERVAALFQGFKA